MACRNSSSVTLLSMVRFFLTPLFKVNDMMHRPFVSLDTYNATAMASASASLILASSSACASALSSLEPFAYHVKSLPMSQMSYGS